MAPECRHIKTSGGKCGSPALRDQPYCYFHSRQRERAACQQPSSLSLAFTSLEDRGAIQHAICEVGVSLAEHRIDRKHASILLYALQVASSNAKYAEEIVSSKAIAEFTRTEQGEEMAPEGATAHPQEESLLDLLIKEVERLRIEREGLSPDQSCQADENKELTEKLQGEGGAPVDHLGPPPEFPAQSLDEFGHPRPQWS
jgi:hypothetical protein